MGPARSCWPAQSQDTVDRPKRPARRLETTACARDHRPIDVSTHATTTPGDAPPHRALRRHAGPDASVSALPAQRRAASRTPLAGLRLDRPSRPGRLPRIRPSRGRLRHVGPPTDSGLGPADRSVANRISGIRDERPSSPVKVENQGTAVAEKPQLLNFCPPLPHTELSLCSARGGFYRGGGAGSRRRPKY